jgi:hypothetical protein
VTESKTYNQLLTKVNEIYHWLDSQISESADLAGQCRACGACCDFDVFDHRLFVTLPELMYLAANLGVENIKTMHTRRCPYNVDGKCSVYEYRFVGCRIFYCKANKEAQNTLSETVMKKLKFLCEELDIPYRYTNLATALNGAAKYLNDFTNS